MLWMLERHQAGATMGQVIVRCCHRELNAADLVGNCLIQPQEWGGAYRSPNYFIDMGRELS